MPIAESVRLNERGRFWVDDDTGLVIVGDDDKQDEEPDYFWCYMMGRGGVGRYRFKSMDARRGVNMTILIQHLR